MIHSTEPPQCAQYHESLLAVFKEVFVSRNDGLLDVQMVGYAFPSDREQILFGQYLLEKKGKKFNKLETRTFKIDGDRLMQVDKKGLERELTNPVSVTSQTLAYTNNRYNYDDWNELQCGHRLLLEFNERANVYIYFNSAAHRRQIQCYLVAKAMGHQKATLFLAYLFPYKQKVIEQFMNKIQKINKSYSKGAHYHKRDLAAKFSICYSQANVVRHLLYRWHSMTKEPAAQLNNSSLHAQNSRVDNLQIELHKLSHLASDEQLDKGVMKIWAGSSTWHQHIQLDSQPVAEAANEPIERQNITTISFASHEPVFEISNKAMKRKNWSIDVFTVLQFQLETEGGGQMEKEVWKSQRFEIINLLDTICNSHKCCKTISLNNGSSRNIQLIFSIRKLTSSIFNLEKDLQQLQQKMKPVIAPICFPILRQIIPKHILSKHLNSLHPKHLQHAYINAHHEFVSKQSVEHISFTPYRKLFDMLKISVIIDKIYQAQPFNGYIDVKYKGTFIYEYLVEKSERLSFYDVEKFIWQYQCQGLRRFLSALKMFDEVPKINFTQPFYELCVMCLQISKMQARHAFQAEYFSNQIIGEESMAFFLVLGILKIGSPLLLYHPLKETLIKSSLLLHYMLKHEKPVLYNKILKLQLNIQALFGVYSASLFSNLLSRSAFVMTLELLIHERKQQISAGHENQRRSQENQKRGQEDDNANSINTNPHFLSLICMFMSILSLMEESGCCSGFLSAEHFIEYIRYYCKHCIDGELLSLKIAYCKHYQICRQAYFDPAQDFQFCQANLPMEPKNPAYSQLLTNLLKFTHRNHYPEAKDNMSASVSELSLGEILEKLYSTFTHYKHKNEGDARKILIRIDQLQLGLSNLLIENHYNANRKPNRKVSYALTLSVYQIPMSSHSPTLPKKKEPQSMKKLYEHQLFNVEPSIDPLSPGCYFNLKHTIELKLEHLNRLFVIIQQRAESNHRNSFRTFASMVNPRELPSNYYIQRVAELEEVSRNTININGMANISSLGRSIHQNRYLMHEIHIKDSCESEYINSTIPEGYINGLLLQGITHSQPAHSPAHYSADSSTRLSAQQQQYVQDVKKCNRYFDKFHNPQSNLNLLYIRLGWYGNHYLIPEQRVLDIRTVSKYYSNYEQNLTNKQFTLQELSPSQEHCNSQILFFTRCVYGRGLLLNSMLRNQQDKQALLSSEYSGVYVSQFFEAPEKEEAGDLLAYSYNNFEMCSNFVEFYWKSMKELPLVRYLGFRTGEFSELNEIRFRLTIPIGGNSVDKPLLKKKGYSEGNDKVIQMSEINRLFQVVLISQSHAKGIPAFLIRQHIPREQAIHYSLQFDQFIATYASRPHNQHASQKFTFLYCDKFMYVDEFMFWLKVNIGKSYVCGKLQQSILSNTGSLYETGTVTSKGSVSKGSGGKGSVGKESLDKKQRSGKKQGRKKGSVDKKEHGKKQSMPNKQATIYQIRMREDIPNMQLYQLYQVVTQTDYEIELQVTSTVMNMVNKYEQSVNFVDYSFVGQKWRLAHILAQFNTPHHTFYYVQQKYTRKKILMDSDNVMVGLTARNFKQFQATDEDVLLMKESITQQMSQF